MKNQNPKKESSHGGRRALRTALKVIGTLFLVLFITVLIFACIFAIYIRTDLSAKVDFSVDFPTMNQTSIIYYQDKETGQWQELQKLYATENRVWVTYDQLPQDLLDACVAIEDKRFYDHPGVDWITTAKASVGLFLGNADAGGSTLTQQLIKNITGEKQVTVRRKIAEIFRALDYEKRYSKEQILEQYLNVIYLSQGCYGVQSASRIFFGKDVWDLTLAECASLIGITNNPSIYDPYLNPEKNRERQLIILNQMLVQEKITQEEYDAAVAQEMVFTSKRADDTEEDNSIYYSYFVDQVIRDVTTDLAKELGCSYAIAEKMLLGGGYQIYCTMDAKVQGELERVYENLDNIPKTTSTQQLQSAMVIIDNETGDIAGIIGGVGEKQGSLDLSRATQSTLSPGSVIKPLTVYSPALDLGMITPISVIDDTPLYFNGDVGYPKNQNNTYRGLVSVNYAVAQSLNTVAAKLVDRMGPAYSYTFAKDKLGLSTLVANVEIAGKVFTDADLAPMAMGNLTHGVTVRALTNAYATIANDGNFRTARTYTKVTDADGVVVLDNRQEAYTAIKSSSAWYMTSMMIDATQTGTATPAKLDGIEVAAKTGTTSSSKDRWFAAFTPYYTGVVWCGFDAPEEVILVGSYTNPALTMWKSVMTGIHEDLPDQKFDRPAALVQCTYCVDSGLLATEACRKDSRGSRVATAYLFQGDVPTTTCTSHVMVDVCTSSGCLANDECRLFSNVTSVGVLDLRRQYSVEGLVVSDELYSLPIPESMLKPNHFPAVAVGTNPLREYCPMHAPLFWE
ncbi:MAG: transglycosylase domain-containing protein [Oscillospiraceae bacterium]|nr:transglycosylase domain-containing protein [Oscillospiraceae bacterium]